MRRIRKSKEVMEGKNISILQRVSFVHLHMNKELFDVSSTEASSLNSSKEKMRNKREKSEGEILKERK